jgi:hypothetical protein
MLLVGGELLVPMLVRGRMPVPVGARLLPLLLQQQADIGLQVVVLMLPLLMLPVVVMMWLVVVVVAGASLRFAVLVGLGGNETATMGFGVVVDAKESVAIDTATCVSASWRSNAAILLVPVSLRVLL